MDTTHQTNSDNTKGIHARDKTVYFCITFNL